MESGVQRELKTNEDLFLSQGSLFVSSFLSLFLSCTIGVGFHPMGLVTVLS